MNQHRRSMITHAAPILTRPGMMLTFRELCDRIRREVPNEYAARCLLFGCAQLGMQVGTGPARTEDNYSLNAISAALLASKTLNERYPLSDETEQEVSTCVNEAKMLAGHSEGVRRDGYPIGAGQDPTRDQVLANMLWVISSNHLFQGDMPHRIANALILTGVLPFMELQAEATQIDGFFRNRFDLVALDFYCCLFGLWSVAQGSIFVNRGRLLENSGRREVLGPVYDSILEELSFRVDTPLTAERFRYAATFTGHSLAESIFLRTPFIQIGAGRFLISSKAYLRTQLTNKFLTRAMALARELEGRPDTAFSRSVGNRLERMVEQLCNKLAPPHGHGGDFEYRITGSGAVKRAPDRVVLESKGNAVVATIIETKAKLFREQTTAGEDLEHLRTEIRGAYSESISQCIKFLYDVFNGFDDQSVSADHLVLIQKLRQVKRIVLLGITPDLPSVFSFKSFRDLLFEAVQERVGDLKWNWFIEKYRGQWFWHIMDLEDLEYFFVLPKRKQLLNYELRRYIIRTGIDTNREGHNGKLPVDFRSYLILNHARQLNEEDFVASTVPELMAAFSAVHRHTLELFQFPRVAVGTNDPTD